jgi:putative ABC transport system substrate-binding protein
MRRRDVIRGLGSAPFLISGPFAATAQIGAKIPRFASLSGGSVEGTKERDACFYDALAKLGWIEGKTITIERRWASGNISRLPALAAELMALKPDVVMTSGTPSAKAMQQADHDIPMVFNMVSDPVASGVVASLARPTANITGVSNFFPAMIGKLLELIKTISGATSFAVLYDPNNPGKQIDVRDLQDNARTLGVTVEPAPTPNAAAVETAFAAMADKRPGALIVLVDAVTINNRQTIVDHAAKLRLPAIYQERTFVTEGGLMSYALDYCAHFARAAAYVDKILKGEKPSNLPVEQPSTFELVVNLKTAKTLGVSVPPTILAVADHVIE